MLWFCVRVWLQHPNYVVCLHCTHWPEALTALTLDCVMCLSTRSLISRHQHAKFLSLQHQQFFLFKDMFCGYRKGLEAKIEICVLGTWGYNTEQRANHTAHDRLKIDDKWETDRVSTPVQCINNYDMTLFPGFIRPWPARKNSNHHHHHHRFYFRQQGP